MAWRSFRETALALRRSPGLSFLSAASVGLSLFVLGLFGLVSYNVNFALQQVEERVEVVAYLSDDVSGKQLEALENDVRSFPEVASVTHVTKLEAMRTAIRQLKEFRQVFSDLDVNPLPASLEIRLKPDHRDPASARHVADLVGLYPFVEDVRYGRDWVEKIYQLRRIAGAVATVLGVAFAIVAVLIIGSAVRMAVLARRDEISVMRLVGATDGYIRRPFLLEGLITGLAGGALAVTLTFIAYYVVDRSLIDLHWLPDGWVVGGVISGGALGLIASGIALRRHLKTYG